MQYWYALYTKPHKERQVEATLVERGIEVYYPTLPVASPRRGRSAERAFFPCYLFAHVDMDAVGLWALHYLPGMRGVVMFAGQPARVDEKIIAVLRSRLERSNAFDSYGEALEQGDRVVITTGPLADLEAVFDRRLSAAGRVRILVHLLQRWAEVEIDADALRKTSAIPQRGHIRKAKS